LGSTRLVSPVTIAALAVPMEIVTRGDHQGYQVSFLGTLVVGAWAVDEIVGQGSRPYRSAGQDCVLRACSQAGLRKRVGAIVGGIVVTVVVVLLLASIVLPSGLLRRRGAAVLAVWPMRRTVRALFPGLTEAFDLLA
jgi:hypothetical protein